MTTHHSRLFFAEMRFENFEIWIKHRRDWSAIIVDGSLTNASLTSFYNFTSTMPQRTKKSNRRACVRYTTSMEDRCDRCVEFREKRRARFRESEIRVCDYFFEMNFWSRTWRANRESRAFFLRNTRSTKCAWFHAHNEKRKINLQLNPRKEFLLKRLSNFW